MVKLRLRRRGRKKRPIYEIVATDSRKARDGEFLEKLGQYNPIDQPSTITLNAERALYWLKCGAQPTKVVRNLLSYEGVLLQWYMERKGKSSEEIAEALAQHKETVAARVQRILIKKRKKKEKAQEEDESAEGEEAAEEAPAAAAEE